MMHTVHAIFNSLFSQLSKEYSPAEATSILWELLIFVTKKSKTKLLTEKIMLAPDEMLRMKDLIDQHLIKHVPIAYLTERVQFGDLALTIRPPILIPRPETEAWCYRLIDLLKPVRNEPLRILDLCTGSGCIALALAHALPQAMIVGVDINPDALALAQENSVQLSIPNCSWIQSDLFTQLAEQQFDIIVANPPYIEPEAWYALDQSVREFESREALVADDHGCALIKKIVTQASRFIRFNRILAHYAIPQLFIEIGFTQAETVDAFMRTHNYASIEMWKDYHDHNRVMCARVSVCEDIKDHPKI